MNKLLYYKKGNNLIAEFLQHNELISQRTEGVYIAGSYHKKWGDLIEAIQEACNIVPPMHKASFNISIIGRTIDDVYGDFIYAINKFNLIQNLNKKESEE